MAVNCSLQPVVASTGAEQVTSGFPMRHAPPTLSGFTLLEAQGILDADFEYPESLVPGACAIRNRLTAASTCIRMPDCRAVVGLQKGADGCSESLFLLKNAGLSPSNGFISPTVYTLQVEEAQSLESNFWLRASEGEVLLSPEAEQQESSGSSTMLDNVTAWKGTIVGRNAVMGGQVLGVASGVATAEECARLCHRAGAGAGNFTGGCNVFNYCEQQGGCRYQDNDLNHEEAVLAQGQCELRHQELVSPDISLPPMLLGKGAEVTFTAGAPLVEWGPQLEGYSRHIGQTLFDSGYQCKGSLGQQVQECVLEGLPVQLAAACSSSVRCKAFLLKPGYIVDRMPTIATVGILKESVMDPPSWVLSPNTVLYVQDASSGGLSAGAIAGIAIGCATAIAGLAAGAWLLVRLRWQKPHQQRAAGGLPPEQPRSHKGSITEEEEVGDEEVAPDTNCGGGNRLWAVQVAPQRGAAAGAPVSPFISSSSKGSGGSRGSSMERPHGPSFRRGPSAVQPFPGAAGRGPLSPGSGTASGGRLGGPGSSTMDLGGGGGGYEAPPILELVQHVAAQDALLVTAGGSSAAPPTDINLPPLSIDVLPPRLHEWVVGPAEFTPLRWPNGKLQEIGSGASAHVYKVLYNGEVVAAKEMDLEASASMQEAFLKEVVWLHALRHPNIVAFYGVCISGSKGTVLMEHCEGRDLHSALEVKVAGTSQRLFSWQRRGRRVAYEIAKALNYLHSKGVVHMDIKSSNVLLTANGAVRIADVGFSCQKTHTMLSNIPLVGTFAWIAPEILAGKQECTEAVDIFSAGVVLWEIVTGERPQRGQLRRAHVPEECPQEVADLMQECLSEHPSDRPTAAQLLHRLGQLLERPKPSDAASRICSATTTAQQEAAAGPSAWRVGCPASPAHATQLSASTQSVALYASTVVFASLLPLLLLSAICTS